MTNFILILFILFINLEIFVCQILPNDSVLTTKTIITTQTTQSPTTKTTTSQPKSTSVNLSSTSTQLQLKVGLLGANASEYRSAYGFGQSVPAISIAIERARNEHLIDNVNFTYLFIIY